MVLAKKLISYQTHKYDDTPYSGEVIDGVRVIQIDMQQFSFDPGIVKVKKGERVRLILRSLDVPHGFEIHGVDLGGYDITTRIRRGFPVTIEFVAGDPGVFEIVCSVYCGFGHSGMKAVFIVDG